MDLILEGIKIGLVLCIMMGPIFFALLQTGVEEGFRAGLMVGTGIWTSDFLYINIVYWGLAYIKSFTAHENFGLYVGLVGAILLLVFGVGALLTPPVDLKNKPRTLRSRLRSFPGLWLRGFLINAFNPFTIFFWVGLMSSVVIRDQLSGQGAFIFFTALFVTVMFTDVLKILMAKRIARVLMPRHVLWMRRISGIALIVFGIALLIRSSLL